MMDKLAGRLSWEHTGNGIRVAIPAKRGWVLLFFIAWLAFWVYGGSQVASKVKNGEDASLFTMVWLIFWFAAAAYTVGYMIWSLAGTTILNVDPTHLEIAHRLGGMVIRTRSFNTGEMRNLRFVPASGTGRSRKDSRICFESADKTIRFATGVTDAEALALIEKMLVIYPFPKERALEYIDLSR